MLGDEEDLIARGAARGFRMPASQSGASRVPGDGLRHVLPRTTGQSAAQPEIHIFQIRFETLVEQPNFVEQCGAK